MNAIATKLNGVLIFEPQVFGDHRGWFMESWNERKMQELGLQIDFIQDNHSFSAEVGTLRGLHYQLPPFAQTKLVRCTQGAILDVVVDIRRSSPTFGQWISVELTAENKKQILVPQGFAHAFMTLVPNCEVQYKVDAYYSPEHDRGLAWNDPDLAIPWPNATPVLSEKDTKHPRLQEAKELFA